MSIDDLSPETLARLNVSRWDRIIEKHEGPEMWERGLRIRDYPPDDIIYRFEPDFDPVAARPRIHAHW